MKLKNFRDYLDKMARDDPHSLYKEFVVYDERTGISYPVRGVDEGQSPAEIVIKTYTDRVIDIEDSFPL